MPSALALVSGKRAAAPGSATRTAARASSTPPEIVAVALLPRVVHSGDTVRWDVKTSPNVTAVSASVKAYRFNLQRVGPGHFGLAFSIPPAVPWFFHGTYTLDLIASDASGAVANTSALIVFR